MATRLFYHAVQGYINMYNTTWINTHSLTMKQPPFVDKCHDMQVKAPNKH